MLAELATSSRHQNTSAAFSCRSSPNNCSFKVLLNCTEICLSTYACQTQMRSLYFWLSVLLCEGAALPNKCLLVLVSVKRRRQGAVLSLTAVRCWVRGAVRWRETLQAPFYGCIGDAATVQ